jgi:hypothetical protein
MRGRLRCLAHFDEVAVGVTHAAADFGVDVDDRGKEHVQPYPDVVDVFEEEGGVPSRLMKADAGDARQEGTPWGMFAGSALGRAMGTVSRLMVSRARVRGG